MTEKDFSVYCPKVLAGIANDQVRWPDTIVDRSVVIRMKPRMRSEPISRMRRPRVREEVGPLCAQLERWASEHISALQVAEPHWPDALDDRTCEAWDPLLAIADLAGGDIPQMARKAAVALQKGNDADDGQAGLVLLGALRDVFGGEHALSSEQICTAINDDDNLPFGAWNKTEGLNARGLAKLLKPFEIKPRTVRPSGASSTARGYLREQFKDPWARWFDDGGKRAEDPPGASPGPVADTSNTSPSQSQNTADFYPTQDPLSVGREPPENPDKHGDVSDVSLTGPGEGQGGVNGTRNGAGEDLADDWLERVMEDNQDL